jgi:BioD-like phosphotransacetylase family protein
MARKIFIAATSQNCGKTTICLSLLYLAQQKYQRIGYLKPLGPKPATLYGLTVDKDAALVAQVFGLTRKLRLMSPVVVQRETTRQALDGSLDTLAYREQILAACRELERHCDFLIVEGSGHPGVGSVLQLSNARIARLLDAPVLMVTGGGIGNVVDSVYLNLALFEKEAVEVRAVLVNKLIPEKRDSTLDYLRRAFAAEPFKVLGAFNYQPVLANPTLRRIARLLDLPLHGNRRDAQRIIHHVQIGAASTQRVAELLREASLLIVTSSRDELLVTMANLYQMPEYRTRIAGLIIPGVLPVSRITQQILDRSKIPYLRTTEHTTSSLYRLITEDVSKITAEDREKLDLIRTLAEMRFDFDTVDALFDP